MDRVLEKLDSLFTLNRRELTVKKGLFMFILIIIAGFSLPIYFKYEDYTYDKYKNEYNYVLEVVESYKNEEGVYPLGNLVNLSEEKELNQFFDKNNLTKNNRLYYIDISLIDELENLKYTYIINPEVGRLYTSEFVVYNFERWHFTFH